MGGCTSTPHTEGTKVVIVGGGFAGYNIANQLIALGGFDVTIVDKKEYFDFFICIPRAYAVKDFFNEISVSYLDSRKGYKNKFNYVQGELVNIENNNNITIRQSNGNTKQLAYSFLVLATGFRYSSPFKTDQNHSLGLRKKEIQSYYERALAAKSVLIVGSGAAGIEQAGELAHYYPDGSKKITIVTRSSRLLATMPEQAGHEAEKWLKEKGVEIRYNTAYDASMDKNYDMVIKTTGQTYNSDFLKQNFASSLAPNGQIYVNDYMQVATADPRKNDSPKAAKPNIFAIGDCTYTKCNEEKNISAIYAFGGHVANNIKSLHNGENPVSQNTLRELPLTAFVSLGPEFAIMVKDGNVVASKDIGAAKLDVCQKSMANFRAPPVPQAA